MSTPGHAPIASPGTNVKGQVAGGSWTFLLPSLELGRVLCVGDVAAAEMGTLRRLASEVVQAPDLASAAGGDFDLVRVAAGRPTGPDSAAGLERLSRLVRAGGLAWVEEIRSPGRRDETGDQTRDVPPAGLREIGRYRLWPVRGEVREAVPDGEAGAAATAFVAATRNSSGTTRARIIGRFRSWVDGRRGQRIGRLFRASGDVSPESTTPMGDLGPRYLVDLAAAHGRELGGRFGLLARGVFNSQKVVVYRFPPGGWAPDLVVKLPREPSLSERLENEHRALERLADVPVATGRVPRVVFFGHHAGLAILGETVVAGRPFREAMAGRRGPVLLDDAVDFLVELGRTTAMPSGPGEQANRIRWLVERFVELYRQSGEQRRALEAYVRRLEGRDSALPVVFQHGDPGTWNLLATAEGRVAFLDWEAAEPRGVPLWDLLYLLRSYVVTRGRLGGLRRRVDVFASTFVGRSQLSPLVIEAIERYRTAVGLPADLLGTLFVTCWVHRAVKEAGRLPAGRLEDGHYANLVRLCLERRGPTLERILDPGGTAVAGRPAVVRR